MVYQYICIDVSSMPSSTTIRISRKTLNLLDELKKRFNVKTYEEVVLRLIREYRRRIVEEYFGVDRGRISSFNEEDRIEDREF